MAEITLYFVITVLKPDIRPYGRAVELTPEWLNEKNVGLRVAVVVPLEHGYIHNAADIITAQLSKEVTPIPTPILTTAGMRFVTDQLEKPYADVQPSDFHKDSKGGDVRFGDNEKFGDDVSDETFGDAVVTATETTSDLPDVSDENFGETTDNAKDNSDEKFEDSDEQWSEK